jgi:hypothetical protein
LGCSNCSDNQPRFWGLTFCAAARRFLIVFMIVVAVLEAAWAIHLPLPQQVVAARHMLFATGLSVAALVIFAFDWWWETRNNVEKEVLILEDWPEKQ